MTTGGAEMALNHPRFSSNGTGKRPEPSQASLEERSRRTAEALAPRYDQLNELWAEAETRLKAMQVPRYVWVVYKREDIEPADPYSRSYCECLGLVKARGEWRLCLGQFVKDEYNGHPSDPDQPTNWKPIADCSVEERVEAAAHLTALRKEVVVSAEHYISKVDEAVSHLTTALAEF
jgi:hypothetical protein